jgi:hypothetical protein
MMVKVENGHQVPNQTTVADCYAVIGHDRGSSVNENTLTEHKGAILGSAQLDWYGRTAQEQASACD